MAKISQKNVAELKDFTGKVKGEVFESFLKYVYEKEGREGTKKLKKKAKEMGASVDFNKIKPCSWIKEGNYFFSVLLAGDIFDWEEEDFFNLGKYIFKISFLEKITLNYFTSFEKALNALTRQWKRYYDFGNLEVVEHSREERYLVVKKEGDKTHPLLCTYHKGFITAGMEHILNNGDVLVEETSCDQEEECEYKVTWR